MSKTDLTPDQLARFDKCYGIYQKKKSRGQAEITWKKWNPDEKLTEVIYLAIQAQNIAGERYCEKRFLRNFSTWLNDMGWKDEIPANMATQEASKGFTCIWCPKPVKFKGLLCPICDKKYKARNRQEVADWLEAKGLFEYGDDLKTLNERCKEHLTNHELFRKLFPNLMRKPK